MHSCTHIKMNKLISDWVNAFNEILQRGLLSLRQKKAGEKN